MSMNIQTITTSDTIKQFMEKCNDNFSSIVENGGGPMGKKGETGETGATGKRGNKFHLVEIEGSDYSEEFPIEEAKELIKDLEDLEDGDFVLFSNGYICDVSLEEDGESSYSVIVNNLISIKGPKGDQGEKGDEGQNPFFEERGGKIFLTENFQDSNIVLGTRVDVETGNPLDIEGGIGFLSNGNEHSAIRQSEEENRFTIHTELDSLSISSQNEIKIYSNNVSISGNNIELNTQNIKFSNQLSIGDNDSKTTITKGIITSTDKIEIGTTDLTTLISNKTIINKGSIKTNTVKTNIITIGQQQLYKTTIENEEGIKTPKINVNNGGFIVGEEILSEIPIIVNNDKDGDVLLDTPKFAMMLYSEYAKVPKYWKVFNKIELFDVIEETGNAIELYDDNNIYFDCGSNHYKIQQIDDDDDFNFIKHILTSDDVIINIDNDTNFLYDSGSGTLTYKAPESPDGFVWIFKTK